MRAPDEVSVPLSTIAVVGLTLRAVVYSAFIRILRKPELLGPVKMGSARSLSTETLGETVETVDRIVRRVVFWRRARCFYRAVAIATVLGNCGYHLVINFGFSERGGRQGRSRVHCWLTLGDELFFEPQTTAEDFPVAMGTSRSGIRYWSDGGVSTRPSASGAGRALTLR